MAKQLRDEEPEAEVEEAPAPGKSRKKLLILVGVGLLAVLLSAGGLTYMLMSGDDGEAEVEAAEPARAGAIYQSLAPAFVVNYTYEGRKRYLQVNVVLMGRDAEGMASVMAHMPLLRNELVLLFGSEDFQTLFSPEGKEALRQRAALAVKALLEKEVGDPVIESVLFTNIVLQ